MFLLLKFSIILFFVQSILTQPDSFEKSAISSGPINTTTANTTTTNSSTSANNATDSATTTTTGSPNTTNITNSTDVTNEDGTKVVVPPIATISHGSAPENGPEGNTITRMPRNLIPPQNCTEERHCKAACGSRVDDSQCIHDTGNCLCVRMGGPPRRCRNVRPMSEMFCFSICEKKVAQICYSDFGNFCTCFLRN